MDDLVKLNTTDTDSLIDLDNHDHHDCSYNHDDVEFEDNSSDPEIEKYYVHFITCQTRLFGRQRPLHCVLGGELWADIVLWRNSVMSASVLGVVTVTWFLMDFVGFSFVTLSCYGLLIALTSLFMWSNLAYFSKLVPPPKESVFAVGEGSFLKAALWLRLKYRHTLRNLEDVVLGRDVKLFVAVIGALWLLVRLGNWFSTSTLVYLMTVTLMTVPMVYEIYEDDVDTFAEKVKIGMRRQYTLFVEKILPEILVAVS